jgi:hypothetical protein
MVYFNSRLNALRKSQDCGDEQTLQQTYSPKEVQDAFKVLMTHWVSQFA